MASITLRRLEPEYGANPLQGYILKVEAINPVDMDAEIFIYQKNRIVVNGSLPDDAANDVFVSVADPVDLQEYPITRPDSSSDEVFYRQSSVELWFRTVEELNEVWEFIKDDVSALLTALNKLNDLSVIEEITF